MSEYEFTNLNESEMEPASVQEEIPMPQEPIQQPQEPIQQPQEPRQPQPEPQPKPKKKKKKTGWIIALVVVIALAAAAGGFYAATAWEHLKSSFQAQEPVQSSGEFELTEQAIPSTLKTNSGNKTLTPAEVYKLNVGAAVGISTESTVTNVFGQPSSTICSGSGFVLTEDGYVVTNYHVVEGANNIWVSLYDGETYKAEMIGGLADNDVALLKIDAENLQCVSVGKSSELEVGEQVVAIGNPLGELTYTMTVGYVSAKDRAINTDGTPINMLQTDVAINSGNSGGPLFDMNGNVVGITSAKYSGRTNSGAYIEGVSFAIPMDDVLHIIYELQQYGYVKGMPYLGVSLRDLDKNTAEVYGLPVGVYVTSVVEGHCAQKAGIKEGDIILSIGDVDVTTGQELSVALRKHRAGDTVELKLYRSGQETTVSVVLDEKPQEQTEETPQTQIQPVVPDETIPGNTMPGFGFGFPFDFFFGR